MERNQRHFDREAEKRSGKQDERDMVRSEAVPAKLRDDGRHQLTLLRERREFDEIEFSCRKKDGEEGQQHRDAADHGVNQELRGGGGAARSSPELDEEEGGDQAELPKDKPVEEIQRGEGAEQASLQQQHQREIEARAFLNLSTTPAMPMGTTIEVNSNISRPRPSMPT